MFRMLLATTAAALLATSAMAQSVDRPGDPATPGATGAPAAERTPGSSTDTETKAPATRPNVSETSAPNAPEPVSQPPGTTGEGTATLPAGAGTDSETIVPGVDTDRQLAHGTAGTASGGFVLFEKMIEYTN